MATIIPFQQTRRTHLCQSSFRRRVRLFFFSGTSLAFLAISALWLLTASYRGFAHLYDGPDLTLDNSLALFGTLLFPGAVAACLYDWLHRQGPRVLTLVPHQQSHSGVETPLKKILLLLFATCSFAFSPSAHASTVSGQIRFNTTPKTVFTSEGKPESDNIVVWLTPQDPQPIIALPPVSISQRNLTFSPTFQVLTLGEELRLPNDDDVAHNVYAMTGPNQFNLGIYKKGDFRSIKFSETGVVDLYCSLHKPMHARIFVVPTPFYASVLPGDQFSIQNVPPGRYILRVWSFRAARVLTKAITVPKAGKITLNLTLDYAPPSNVAME